ncbi:MAG: 1-acyl-sn-glycerol-3-phosphate acyltransferase [Steroidobacteraceae bacterium]|nr:1-acyl-sn-glycerol-3-phosphate acyltransferase [Steroidobacteraceae bacterium]
MFIRRSFRGNTLYTIVFMKYLAAIMARGHSLEYFIEGGRSRTGLLLQPKTGMLSMTVRSYLRDPVRAVVFVPVYFGYERLVEANTYVAELSGQPKKRETVADLLRALRVLREKFGRVHVNIGEPIHLDALLERHRPGWRAERHADESRAGWLVPLVDELAQAIMCNINSAAAVTPINLLGTILLATPRLTMLYDDLIRQLQVCVALLRALAYGPRVTMTTLTAEQIVDYGVAMRVIERAAHPAGELVRMSGSAAVLATYYRNNVLHLFALPSLIACAFRSNAELRTADLQRLVGRVYPYVAAELFLRWDEHAVPAVVERVIDALATQRLIEAAAGGQSWRRPPPNSAQAVQLSNLAQATIQIIERYYLAIAVLRDAGSGQIDATALVGRCALLAQRISVLFGINSPEFSDRSLFENFIQRLLARDVIRVNGDGKLVFDEVLQRVIADAELVLSEQMRHSILQVTHR